MKYNRKSKTYITGISYEKFIKEYFLKEKNIELKFFETEIEQYHGETLNGLEIKFDGQMIKTNNLYIEYQEKSDKNNLIFVNSGILKKDNSKYFLIGNYNEFFVFKKEQLIKYHIENKWWKRYVNKPTSNGYLMPKYIAYSTALFYQPITDLAIVQYNSVMEDIKYKK